MIFDVSQSTIWVMCTIAIAVRFWSECHYQVAITTLVTNDYDPVNAKKVLRHPLYRFGIAVMASLPTFIAATTVYMIEAYNFFIYLWTILSMTRSLKLWLECNDNSSPYRYPQDSIPFVKSRMCLLFLGLVVFLM